MNDGMDLVKLIGEMFIDSVKNKLIISQLAQKAVTLEKELADLKKEPTNE